MLEALKKKKVNQLKWWKYGDGEDHQGQVYGAGAA
jgi:hypothetical protein